jgi:tricorn protease-like protein
VVALRNAPSYVAPAKKENNNEWVIVNRVSYNSKTGKTSVRFVPMTKGSNKKVTYILKSADRTVVLGEYIPETFKSMVQDSYWRNSSCPVVQSVNINNIIALHNRAMG